MTILEVNGAELFVDDQGQGRVLLLIHAGIADSSMWDDQVAAFSKGHRMVRLDMRGFGRSNLPAGTFSNVQDVAGVLRALEIDRLTVMGCSFGGLVALDFTLTYPEMVRHLILVAPSVSGSSPSERIKAFWDAEEQALEQGDLQAATELNLRLWVDGPQRRPEQVDPQVRQKVHDMQMTIFQKPEPEDIDEIPIDPPAIGRLSEVRIPTLIIVGDLDLQEKLDLADQLELELPYGELVVIEGAAHMVSMEKPLAFNHLVEDFLARMEADGGE